MAELLPCPFCRSDDLDEQRGRLVHVFCLDCQASGPGGDDLSVALAAWNRRAAPDPALLAPAKLGARLCRDQLSPTGGFCHARYEHLDRIGIEEGALIPGCLDSTGPVPKPGIADAIAALLAPDGAGESEVRS